MPPPESLFLSGKHRRFCLFFPDKSATINEGRKDKLFSGTGGKSMKCIKRIRPVLIGVSVFLCSCLTGCSLSFCGIGTPKEEFVFYCDTEPERTEQTEKTEKTEETEQKEQELPEEQQEADARVNINTAGVEELMTLKGVGESRAQAIIAWRTEQGPFEKPEDIMLISGIKEGVYSRIKDQIRVH